MDSNIFRCCALIEICSHTSAECTNVLQTRKKIFENLLIFCPVPLLFFLITNGDWEFDGHFMKLTGETYIIL